MEIKKVVKFVTDVKSVFLFYDLSGFSMLNERITLQHALYSSHVYTYIHRNITAD